MIIENNDDFVLYNDDCIKVLENENIRFDKVITSPPYNIIRPNSTDRGYDLYKDGLSNEQYSQWIVKLFNLFDKRMNENGCVLFNMSYGTENTTCMIQTIAEVIQKTNFTIADILVWKKNNATPNNVSSNKMTRICEFVYVMCRKGEFNTFTSNKKVVNERETGQKIYENLFNHFEAKNNDESTELNKATFSTEFVKNLIDRYVLKKDVVLDCFSGTGTTISCCVANDIKCIGIELSKKQCEYTMERMKEVQMMLI